jgi:hypothetical protein
VPSAYVGTDTLLSPDIFNDVPATATNTSGAETVGVNLTGFDDPRYNFQPPFNKVSRRRDPGQVNLNTVTGRRLPPDPNDPPALQQPRHWSEVYDGLMHRIEDRNEVDPQGNPLRLSHLGPAWRDVVISRKGYVQFDAGGNDPLEKLDDDLPPDVFAFGLNPNFPSVFSNPFRPSDAGDFVPLAQMLRFGVDASWLRTHHFSRDFGVWGRPAGNNFNGDDNGDGSIDDTREAGFGGDELFFSPSTHALLPARFGDIAGNDRGIYPLFSESFTAPFVDGERNPYFYYQPMSRLGNLVTNRSNVFAVWITVGYFEVEKAPNWAANENNVQARFGGDINLYNRVYPDGYMLGREVGSETGNTKRHRGFYIVDRSEPVGFKPGEDLNVENMIRVRRRIE